MGCAFSASNLLVRLLTRVCSQARDHMKMLLSRRGKSLRDVVAVLDEYRANIGVDEDLPEDAPPTEGEERRAILEQLGQYLDSVA